MIVITMYLVFSILQQDVDWISVVNTLGFPVAIAIALAIFLFRVVWPWMTNTMQEYVEINRKQNEQYIKNLEKQTEQYAGLVRELRQEFKDRDARQREEDVRREKEYRDLLQQQAQYNINVLEIIHANTSAMNSLGSAVDKLRDAAKLEERLAELEEKYKNR